MQNISRSLERDGSVTLQIAGKWTHEAEIEVARGGFDLLLIQAAGGALSGLVKNGSNIRRLQIQGPLDSSAGLESLSQLLHLTLTDVPKPPIDLAAFPHLESFCLQWHRSYGDSAFSLRELKAAVIFGYTEEDCSDISRATSLERLHLTQGGVKCLKGLEVVRGLADLKLAYLKNLTQIDEVAHLPSLTSVWIERCLKLHDLNSLKNLARLETLYIAESGSLHDVDWLRSLSALRRLTLILPIETISWPALFGLQALSFLHIRTKRDLAISQVQAVKLAGEVGKAITSFSETHTKTTSVLTVKFSSPLLPRPNVR